MLNSKKILILGSYPVNVPRHGGQIRASQIINNYNKLEYLTTYVGVYRYSDYSKHGLRSCQDIYIDDELIDKNKAKISNKLGFIINQNSLIVNLVNQLNEEKEKLVNLINEADIVQFEQIYTFGLVADDLSVLKGKTIVYSSHNIEHQFFNDPLEKKYIIDLEKKLLNIANIAIVSTKNEEKEYLKTNSTVKIIYLKNSFLPRKNNITSDRINQFIHKNNINQYGLFISSAHQNNFDGFLELIGFALGSLKDDEYLIIAGGVVQLLIDYLSKSKNPRKVVIEDKVKTITDVEDHELDTLIKKSKFILLPIISGSGSSLKTVEALYYQKDILATSVAFRDFENYMKYSNVHIADNQTEYIKQLKKLFLVEKNNFKLIYNKEELTWQYSFDQINEQLKVLL